MTNAYSVNEKTSDKTQDILSKAEDVQKKVYDVEREVQDVQWGVQKVQLSIDASAMSKVPNSKALPAW